MCIAAETNETSPQTDKSADDPVPSRKLSLEGMGIYDELLNALGCSSRYVDE
jgi:hypothetical protein